MRTVYIGYHSYARRETICIATSISKAVKICCLHAEIRGTKIEGDQLWNLQNLGHTQGYEAIGEYYIEPVDMNKLL